MIAMVIARRPPGIAPMWVLTKHYEGVALLGVWGARGCYRDQGAFGVDQEQQVGGRGIRPSDDWVVMRAPAV